MSIDWPTKRAVIVGGSKGLGFSTVKLLAEKGAQVVVLARSRGELDSLPVELAERIFFIATDIGDANSVRAAFSEIKGGGATIDYLVLNAALTLPSKAASISDEEVTMNLRVNIGGMIYCLRDAIPLMKNGVVVYISSESVVDPFPMLAMYGAVKSCMETYLRGIRQELYRDHGISISVLRAGAMSGTSFTESWSESRKQEFLEMATHHIGRTGSPMETRVVADTILHILSLPPAANLHLLECRSIDSH